MENNLHTGGCLCGQVRYRVEGVPVDAGYCHCRICQRASGAQVVAWVTFPIDCFRLTEGELASYESSDVAVRHFCARCGTQITFRKLENPTLVDITLATLDDPSVLPPHYHIWTISQIPWLQIADDLPRHEESGPDLLA